MPQSDQVQETEIKDGVKFSVKLFKQGQEIAKTDNLNQDLNLELDLNDEFSAEPVSNLAAISECATPQPNKFCISKISNSAWDYDFKLVPKGNVSPVVGNKTFEARLVSKNNPASQSVATPELKNSFSFSVLQVPSGPETPPASQPSEGGGGGDTPGQVSPPEPVGGNNQGERTENPPAKTDSETSSGTNNSSENKPSFTQSPIPLVDSKPPVEKLSTDFSVPIVVTASKNDTKNPTGFTVYSSDESAGQTPKTLTRDLAMRGHEDNFKIEQNSDFKNNKIALSESEDSPKKSNNSAKAKNAEENHNGYWDWKLILGATSVVAGLGWIGARIFMKKLN